MTRVQKVSRNQPARCLKYVVILRLASSDQAFCKDRLAAYKYPRIVEAIKELPKGPTGKILKRELRD